MPVLEERELEDGTTVYESATGEIVEGNTESKVLDNIDAEVEAKIEAQPTEAPEQEPQLPDKYQNKSAAELVQMHQEAEKALGRQGSEVGELRRLVDNYIMQNSSNAATQQVDAEEEEIDDLDFIENPKEAIARAIKSDPTIRELLNTTTQVKTKSAQDQILERVPNIKDHVQDPAFAEWVGQSPIRQELLQRTDQYDVNAAVELFTQFEATKGVSPAKQPETNQTVQAEQQARKEQVRQADTGNVRGTQEATPKKKYRRADIMKLMVEDPERYEQLQPEILAAYAEKRVF